MDRQHDRSISESVERIRLMVTDLVRAVSPEEREYARLLAEIEQRKAVVASLQQEIAQLKTEIAAFEAEYHATIGPLYLELDRLKAAIRQYEIQIARLHDDPLADPDLIEREAAAEMHAAWERLRQDEAENRAWQEARNTQQTLPELDPETKDELLRMYRELARRHHPDLARTDEERLQREPIMQRINEALAVRDFALMKSLLAESEFLDPSFEGRSIGDRLVWAIREIDRLDGLSGSLEQALQDLRSCESCRLLELLGPSGVHESSLATELRAQIANDSMTLATLVSLWTRMRQGGGESE